MTNKTHQVISRADGYGNRSCICGGVWNDAEQRCRNDKTLVEKLQKYHDECCDTHEAKVGLMEAIHVARAHHSEATIGSDNTQTVYNLLEQNKLLNEQLDSSLQTNIAMGKKLVAMSSALREADYSLRIAKRDVKNWYTSQAAASETIKVIDNGITEIESVLEASHE